MCTVAVTAGHVSLAGSLRTSHVGLFVIAGLWGGCWFSWNHVLEFVLGASTVLQACWLAVAATLLLYHARSVYQASTQWQGAASASGLLTCQPWVCIVFHPLCSTAFVSNSAL